MRKMMKGLVFVCCGGLVGIVAYGLFNFYVGYSMIQFTIAFLFYAAGFIVFALLSSLLGKIIN